VTFVNEDLDLPNSGTPWPAEVRVRLAGAQGRPVLGRQNSTGNSIVGEVVLSTGNGINNAGFWELDLIPSNDILPEGTRWRCERRVGGCQTYVSFLNVPVTGGPYAATLLEDDLMGEITPSALSFHASDLALHGGGIEIDFKYIDSAVVVTGTGGGLTLTPIPGLQITVPDLARAVMVHGRVPAMQQTGGPSEQSWGIFATDSGYGAFASLDSITPAGLVTTNSRTGDLWVRLPSHSAKNYAIAATGQGGNLTAKANASVLQRAFLRAVAL
jgi:hypothetical protein